MDVKRRAPLNLRPEWMKGAVCASVDPELWFPAKEADPGFRAKRICRSCPVRIECLAYAMANDEPYGIWGGKSRQERAKLKLVKSPLTAVILSGLG